MASLIERERRQVWGVLQARLPHRTFNLEEVPSKRIAWNQGLADGSHLPGLRPRGAERLRQDHRSACLRVRVQAACHLVKARHTDGQGNCIWT